MLRSMYSGISGMKVNQTKLDVIGNNIANVGTTAYKSQRTTFANMLSQEVSSAQAPSQTQGGVNSAQVGLGVKLASIDSVMTNGNLQSTGRNLDVAIDKAGYFIVSNGPEIAGDNLLQVTHSVGTHTIDKTSITNTGSDIMYSRAGSFILDNAGNLLTSDGYRVMGYSLTNDDNSRAATQETSTSVSAGGFDFNFGPGSQLNGYNVVFGKVGPNTVTTATIDKQAKQIIINADMSVNSTVTTEQVQAAVNNALTTASISQNVTIGGKLSTLEGLSTEKITGGSNASSPKTLVFNGFTMSLTEGAELNGFTFQIGDLNSSEIEVYVNKDPDVKTITINGNFASGNVTSAKLKDAINEALSSEGIKQSVKNLSGAPLTLNGVSGEVQNTTLAKAATVTDYTPHPRNGGYLGPYSITMSPTEGYCADINGYTFKYGDVIYDETGTNTTPVTVNVDKATKSIIIHGAVGSANAANDIKTKINEALEAAGLNSKIRSVSVSSTFTSTDLKQISCKFGGGVDYARPSDIEIAQGLTISFPNSDNKTVASPLDGYKFVLSDIRKDTLDIQVDKNKKEIAISGNFVISGKVTNSELQSKLNEVLQAQGLLAKDSNNSYETLKVTGTTKAYKGLESDEVTDGAENLAPGQVQAFGLIFEPSPGSTLNNYKIQIGNISSGTATSATVDETAKLIIINADFVSGTTTALNIQKAINNALANKGIDQSLTVTGTPTVVSATESVETNGGTSVQSLATDGTVNFVDATGKVSAYDNSLKSLKIPDTVTIAGTGQVLRVKSFTIDQQGIINATLEDGRVSALGQIALATFKNQEGLTRLAGNLFSESVNSGDALIKSGIGTLGEDNSLGYGETVQNMLEMSNVDLAEQFTEMITSTRAFQANGKIINTGDEILQDIINLKR